MPQPSDWMGFWAGGHRQHIEALEKAEALELAALERRRADASPAERAEIEAEIQRVRVKYLSERRSSAHSLYALGEQRNAGDAQSD